jgi:ABC-type uncharacterized transport system involved in gliding motility auxiliary subunit
MTTKAKKRFDFRSLIRDKKLRYGGYATLVSAVVIGVVIALNVVVDQIPAKIDMTERGFYSLSEQTIQILDRLGQDIAIYGFFQTGRENTMLEELIRKYTVRSRRVSYRTVDPLRNPAFAKQYEKDGTSVGESSLVVESGGRFKTLSQFDLYNLSYDQQSQTQQVQSQQFEAQITSAILYVTTDDLPAIGTLSLHDEQPLPYAVTKQLGLENYTVRDVNLTTEGRVPEDLNVLVVNGPQRDLQPDELQKLRTYLAAGGRMLLHFSLVPSELSGWNDLLSGFGLAVRNRLVVEQDPQRHAAQVPVYLIPELQVHDILSPLRTADMIVVAPISVYVEELELKKRTTTIERLITTSNQAYAKADANPNDLSLAPQDARGPFSIATAASDRLDEQGQVFSRIVVVGNVNYLDLAEQFPGNGNFFLNAVSWLYEREDTLSIRSKSLRTLPMFMNQQVALLLSALVVILIPLIAFGIGVTVWLRRRHL